MAARYTRIAPAPDESPIPMSEIRAAVRALAHRPSFAAVAIATLALGIGGNAAIFSLIDRVLLRPLPYPRSEQLVMPWEFSAEVQQRTGFDRLPSSPGDVFDFRARNTTFEHLAWVRAERVNLTGTGDPERISAVRVSGDFFQTLGVSASIGRVFTPEDAGEHRFLLLGNALWRRRFGGDPDVVGQVISVNGEPATILGVLPPWFRFPGAGDLPSGFGFANDPEIWSLDVLTPAQQRSRGGKSFALIGRLREGVGLQEAQGDLGSIAAAIARDFPASNAGWTVRVVPLREQLVGEMRSALLVLLVAVGCVLLIACVNVANLMLVRASGRQREMCVRLALGAGEGRLVRQLLVESLMLSLAAGGLGLLIGWAGLRVLLSISPRALTSITAAALDWRVLAFTLVLSTLTGVMFGIVPAIQAANADLNAGLREGSPRAGGGRKARRTRNALVVVEVAMAMVLLVSAVLLMQTFVKLLNVPAGFRTDGVLTMEVSLPRPAYPGSRAADFFDRVIERLRGVPGVETVAVSSDIPLSGLENLRQVTVEGAPRPDPGREIIADYRVVTPDYFAVMGIPLVSGEALPNASAAGGAPGLLINATMAEAAWPHQNAVGRRLKLTSFDQDAPWFTVLGVVGDTRHSGLDRSLRPQVYVHQRTDPSQQMVVVMRTAGEPAGFASVARAAVLEIDRDQPVGRIRTMRDVVAASVASRRFTMALVATFAALALTLSLVGLYAVVSHSVAERTREMGVRLALGATPGSLLCMVMCEGLSLAGAGVGLGLLGAFLSTRFIAALLFGVEAHDATTFAAVSVLLFAAAALGCLMPARRAMRVDPMVALRAE